MKRLIASLLLMVAYPAASQDQTAPPPSAGLEQLRHVVGSWRVETRFRQQDGSETEPFVGSYQFEWVIEDAVLRGVSETPELGQRSVILFYLRPARNEIEMVSVGADGKLWVMTGRDGLETRETPDLPTTDGGTMRLRFTRFNVTPERFESRMEWSVDQGASWSPGNHQVFVRCSSDVAC
ncbi:hypothetical protein [Blastomonas sp.]|uniref:hypothetical protein n=1 Tax=Blastomonas sp. TaxID=1909299 RepID=UPI0035936025